MGEAEEVNKYIGQIEGELEAQKEKNAELNESLHGQMNLFNNENQENLIRWQLDMKEDLDRIYHLLKGDELKQEKDGKLYYETPKEDNLRPFNEFGVKLIMNIMSFYLNRNTILSNYDEKTIYWKVFDFGNELADLIFNRYEEMGMDNSEKIKMYPMIVKELIDTIHSAYLRAYHGGERESLRTARTVTQSEPLYGPGMNYQPVQKKSKLNPFNWGR